MATEQLMRTSFVTLYGVGALVTGAILARAALGTGAGWLLANPPRTVVAWMIVPLGLVAVVVVGVVALSYVLLVWPIVLTVRMQTRHRREAVHRALDAEEEAELFREARRLGRRPSRFGNTALPAYSTRRASETICRTPPVEA